MMSRDQQAIVSQVYRRFCESDSADEGWTDVDEQMSMLEWLENHQLTVEAAVKLQEQSSGSPRCNAKHSPEVCFVPVIIEAVGYILDLYSTTGHLPAKSEFILQYYLALSQVGFILY